MSKKLPDIKIILYIAAGVFGGLFCVFFAMANNHWVLIKFPVFPLRTSLSFFALESRLWVVFTTGLLSGAFLFFIFYLHKKSKWREINKNLEDEYAFTTKKMSNLEKACATYENHKTRDKIKD